MSKTITREQSLAASRRAERQAAHERMLAQHATRRAAQEAAQAAQEAEHEAAIAAYKRYWSAWLRGGCKGPKPVKPLFM